MRYASGKVLTPQGFIDGHIGFEGGYIQEVGKGKAKDSVAQGIITPTLVNAHTHLADYIVPMDLGMSLEELVAPPKGFKHRMLEEAGDDILAKSMIKMANLMRQRGISRYIDFREGGLRGAKLLSLSKGKPGVVIMGRPQGLSFDEEEIDTLLRVADGVGASSLSDWDYSQLLALAEFTKSKGKRLGIHVSEREREDIDKVLDLKPDFVVHMNKATSGDLEACAKQGVPIVVCPRSNLFFGCETPLAKMLEAGACICLGTDNGMLCLPDILLEMEFAGRLLRKQGVKDISSVLDMAIINGRKLLNETISIGIEPGTPCDFMVTRSHNGNPSTDLVLRSSSIDPLMVCMGKEIWSGVQ